MQEVGWQKLNTGDEYSRTAETTYAGADRSWRTTERVETTTADVLTSGFDDGQPTGDRRDGDRPTSKHPNTPTIR